MLARAPGPTLAIIIIIIIIIINWRPPGSLDRWIDCGWPPSGPCMGGVLHTYWWYGYSPVLVTVCHKQSPKQVHTRTTNRCKDPPNAYSSSSESSWSGGRTSWVWSAVWVGSEDWASWSSTIIMPSKLASSL